MATTVSFTEEIPAKVSATRMFEAGVVHFHTLAPVILPEYVKTATIVQGDGLAGSVKLYTLSEAAPFPFIKEYIDVLDKEKLETQYTVIEGGDLGTKTTSMVYHLQLVPTDDGTSSICRLTGVYKLLSGIDYAKEMELDKVLLRTMVTALENYLLQNPTIYA